MQPIPRSTQPLIDDIIFQQFEEPRQQLAILGQELLNAPLLQNLSIDELQRLESHARFRVFPRQQLICQQNSPSRRVFFIASGCATIEKISNNGYRQILAFAYPGDFVGLSHCEHYDYAVKSLTDMTAYEFQRKTLRQLSETTVPTLKTNLKSIRSTALQMTFQHIILLGRKKARERVAFFILDVLDRLPKADPEHLALPMTRQDMADFLGTSVETVSRAISRLKRQGLITTPAPNAIKILDLDGLNDIAALE